MLVFVVFFSESDSKLRSLPAIRNESSNLSPPMSQALKQLQTYTHLEIKQSDKGGNVVVMDVEYYKQLCLKILNNREWYKQISPLLIGNVNLQFNNILHEALQREVISMTIIEFLFTPHSKMATFYHFLRPIRVWIKSQADLLCLT